VSTPCGGSPALRLAGLPYAMDHQTGPGTPRVSSTAGPAIVDPQAAHIQRLLRSVRTSGPEQAEWRTVDQESESFWHKSEPPFGLPLRRG